MKEEQKIGFGLVLRAIAKKDDKLLLLQRPSKSSHDNGRWELPGGKIKKGEFFDEGLRREVKEETGLDIKILGFISQCGNALCSGRWRNPIEQGT